MRNKLVCLKAYLDEHFDNAERWSLDFSNLKHNQWYHIVSISADKIKLYNDNANIAIDNYEGYQTFANDLA